MRMKHLMRFEEAREAFQKYPTAEAALLLHRVALRAYLDGKISESDFNAALEQADLFMAPASSVEQH
jgi:hypothetical protein